MTVRTSTGERRSPDPARTPRRDEATARTAIGRAHGRHRTLLIATCVALVLAAIGDEATGYDGPGPFVDLAFAAVVALVWWRFVPPLVIAMCAFFVFGGFADSAFASHLVEPGQVLDFTAGWLQMLGFVAAAVLVTLAARSARYARRASR
ncbi:hypothetical protein K7472_02755 [Streptomyces sp. PTM05]|uniref:Integral membrane protein n=1 Tax=Streptantibioticus parmotrematis TaxID=2873249 RepID=A0ABS7QKQ5_9ACTN|nr:hypothetical protein [Streptantibioticus parmotrematis]MBY8883763.1 hypothetical protein [Streptantibioticus parmotrematis]